MADRCAECGVLETEPDERKCQYCRAARCGECDAVLSPGEREWWYCWCSACMSKPSPTRGVRLHDGVCWCLQCVAAMTRTEQVLQGKQDEAECLGCTAEELPDVCENLSAGFIADLVCRANSRGGEA